MSAFSALIGSCYYHAVSLSWKISFSGEKHVSRAERFFVSEKHIDMFERFPVLVKNISTELKDFLYQWKTY